MIAGTVAASGCKRFPLDQPGARFPLKGAIRVMVRIIPLTGLIFGLIVLLAPMSLSAQERRPHSVLVLDQSDLRGPFYYQLSAGLRGVLGTHAETPVTIYGETLDLTRFGGAAYEASLKRHFQEKDRDRPIGVIVAIGAGTLEHTLRWHEELWPAVPIVFAMLDETEFAKLGRSADVTGVVMKIPLAGAIEAARAVVHDLHTVALVGNAWNRRVLFSHWVDEIPAATFGLNVVDLVGQKVSDVRKRVAELPERSAIISTAVFSDGVGTYYPPSTALGMIAEKANRPIVVGAQPLLPAGGIGGYTLIPSEIGADAARLAMRVDACYWRRASRRYSAGHARGKTAVQLESDAALERQRIQPAQG